MIQTNKNFALSKAQLDLLEKSKPTPKQTIIYYLLFSVPLVISTIYITRERTESITIVALTIWNLFILIFGFYFIGAHHRVLSNFNNDLKNAFGTYIEGKVSGQSILSSKDPITQIRFWINGQQYIKLGGDLGLIQNGNYLRIFAAPLSRIVFEVEIKEPPAPIADQKLNCNLIKTKTLRLEPDERKYIASLSKSLNIIGNSLVISIYLGPIGGYFLGLYAHGYFLKDYGLTLHQSHLYSILLLFLLSFGIVFRFQGSTYRSILVEDSKVIMLLKIDSFSTIKQKKRIVHTVKLQGKEGSFEHIIDNDAYVAISSHKEGLFHFDIHKHLLLHVYDTSGKLFWSAVRKP